jgi:hypothetical protein
MGARMRGLFETIHALYKQCAFVQPDSFNLAGTKNELKRLLNDIKSGSTRDFYKGLINACHAHVQFTDVLYHMLTEFELRFSSSDV